MPTTSLVEHSSKTRHASMAANATIESLCLSSTKVGHDAFLLEDNDDDNDDDPQSSTLRSLNLFIDIAFGCMGIPHHLLFTPTELLDIPPSTLLDNICLRADSYDILLCQLYPLLASFSKEIAQKRTIQLNELHSKLKQLEQLGLQQLTRDPVSGKSATEILRLRDLTSPDDLDRLKFVRAQRWKKYDSLRDNLANFFHQSFLREEVVWLQKDFLSLLTAEWLIPMSQSRLRSARHTGCFLAGSLGLEMATRIEMLHKEYCLCSEQLRADAADRSGSEMIERRMAQMRESLSSLIGLLKTLKSSIIPLLVGRHMDVSWQIRYEVLVLLVALSRKLPIYFLLSNDRCLETFWTSAIECKTNEVRLMALESLHTLLESLAQALTSGKGSFRDAILSFPDEDLQTLLPSTVKDRDRYSQSLCKQFAKLDSLAPKLPSTCSARLNSFLAVVFPIVSRHCQDPDIRVAIAAARTLKHLSQFEMRLKQVWADVRIEDGELTRAASLLLLVDSPFVREELAAFVDCAVFEKSIIDEEGVIEMLTASEESSSEPSLSAEKVKELSLHLCTLVEFFKDFVNEDYLVARHNQGIKAFWTLAPVLHHWDLLLQHLVLTFGAQPLQQISASGSLWVSPDCRHSLLSILLGVLECQRLVLGGKSRYASFPDFQPFTFQSSPSTDPHRLLAEINHPSGFRLNHSSPTDPLAPDVALADNLWDLTSCKPFLAKRLARNILTLWTLANTILNGCKSDCDQLILCLAVVYELIDATTAINVSIELVRTEVDHSELINCGRQLTETCCGLIKTQRDRRVLKCLFAILHQLRTQVNHVRHRQAEDQETNQESIDQPLTVYHNYLNEQQQTVKNFIELTRRSALEDIRQQIGRLPLVGGKSLLEDSPEAQSAFAALRCSLQTLAVLAENDNVNTFRHGLETLDDMLGLIEVKQRHLKGAVDLESCKIEPSESTMVLVFDVLWMALAQWMEQIDTRFEIYLSKDVSALMAGSAGPFEPQYSMTATKLTERLRIFKEDLEIFKELISQVLSLASSLSEALRMQLCGDGASMIPEHRKKSMLITCMATAALALNTEYFHLISTLWHRIEELLSNLLKHPMRVALPEEGLESCTRIIALVRECWSPKRVEAIRELAYFADSLSVMSGPHQRHIGDQDLEKDFPQEALSLGLWDGNWSHPSLSSSPFGVLSVHKIFRNQISESAVESFCDNLPCLPELAYMFHVQLLAAICQLPDIELWMEGSVGMVILHGLSSKSCISQRMAYAFIDRLRLYEKIKYRECERAREFADAGAERLSMNWGEQLVLPQILLTTIWTAIVRAVKEKKAVTDATKIAERASKHLNPEYLVSLSDKVYNSFVLKALKMAWGSESNAEIGERFLEVVGESFVSGARPKAFRRKWRREVAQQNLNLIWEENKAHIRPHLTRAISKFLKIAYAPAQLNTSSSNNQSSSDDDDDDDDLEDALEEESEEEDRAGQTSS